MLFFVQHLSTSSRLLIKLTLGTFLTYDLKYNIKGGKNKTNENNEKRHAEQLSAGKMDSTSSFEEADRRCMNFQHPLSYTLTNYP